MNLGKNINIVRVMNDVAAGTTVQNSTHVDMQGWDGVLFIVGIGALTAGQVTNAKLQGGNAVNDSDQADLSTPLASAALADGNSNISILLDLYRPQERYIRCVVNRATQNAVIDGVWAIQYQGEKIPPALDASIFSLTTGTGV
jgi:hypothetical protein